MENSTIGTIKNEKLLKPANGMLVLIINIVLIVVSVLGIIFGHSMLARAGGPIYVVILIASYTYIGIICWLLFFGLKLLKPNEAYVFTLFGNYYGTLKKEGLYFIHPFVTAFNPTYVAFQGDATKAKSGLSAADKELQSRTKKISTKVQTLDNPIQKINDLLGNPINIGIVVIWKVVNPTWAVFNVENFKRYLSIQADSVLRNVVRKYPYDISSDGDEKSLRGSSLKIAETLKAEIQEKVEFAGIEIQEAKITTLAYSPEIAAAMLQRQQASAIIDARKMIVEGAVGMVQLALEKLKEEGTVELDEERKATMISNLMVVLCANKETQPVVNSGSLY